MSAERDCLLDDILKNELKKEAESIYKCSRFKAGIKNGTDSTGNMNTVRVKVISKLNYVTHVSFEIKNGYVTGFLCDGTGLYCNKYFCGHCFAALKYLREDEQLSVFLPEKNDEDKTCEESNDDTEILPHVNGELHSGEFTTENSRPYITASDASDNHSEQVTAEQTDASFVPRQIRTVLGIAAESGEEVVFAPNDTDKTMNMNMGIIGTTGTGKTQFTKSLVTQLYLRRNDNFDGSPFGILIFDYKGDYNETKPDFVKAVNAKVIKPYRMPYNPLSLNLKESNNKMLLPRHTASVFAGTVTKIFNLGPKQENTLFECIMEAYKQQRIMDDVELTWSRPAPTFETVYQIYKKSAAYGVNDMLSVVMNRLSGFAIFDPEPERVLPLKKILNGAVVIDISDYDSKIQNLVVAITLEQFYSQMHTFGSSKTDGKLRQIKNLILVDEADNFMKTGLPVLRGIMKEGREFGVGTLLSTQSLSHFNGNDDDYSRYISSWVIHNVNDLNRRNIEAILNQYQKSAESEELFRTIKSLKKHESVVKLSGAEPVVMRDKPFWELVRDKNI